MIKNIVKDLSGDKIKPYRPIPFWSWNDELEIPELIRQIKWMKENGFGGYFMHARGGLTTEYLGDKWFDCIKACLDEGEKDGLESWAYDENGWPSGFAGGKLLDDQENCDRYLTYTKGKYDKEAMVSYRIDGDRFIRASEDGDGVYLNVYEHISNSTADILNGEVVDKFISLTHEEYRKRFNSEFGKKLKGFFTDEPQYYRWGHPYTKVLPEYFLKNYGIDIKDGLGLMFVERNGYRDFRYKYWKAMQSLMLRNFAEKIYNWCDKNGCELTGHYVEETTLEFQDMCCGGVMPFYEYEHIPGMDHLGVYVSGAIAPKQLASVAAQLGKKRVLTETYGCCGWGVTPLTLKRIAESQFVYGVNLMCQHLLPYSEHGQRKRDYPAHYSWSNPWVRKDFRTFNNYFARLGYLIGNSKEIVNVAVFNPLTSTYFDYKRENIYNGKLSIDISYESLTGELAKMNIPYHIADETIMAKHGKVENGKLIIGECSYDFIVFPLVYTMDKSTKRLLDKFYSQGGKVLFTEGLPAYLEGEEFSYNYSNNFTIDEIASAQPYRISDSNTDIRSAIREIDGKRFIFATNLSEDKNYKINFSGDFKGFECLNLETLSTESKNTEITFYPGDSYVLFMSDIKVDEKSIYNEITLNGSFTVKSDSGNYLTLDMLSYSLDGTNYSDKLRYMGVFNELLNKRYNGDVYLKYDFNVRDVPETIYLLAEDLHNIWCEVNGKRVVFNEESDFEKQLYKSDISKFVTTGNNSVVFKINFFESENVYNVLFGNVNESLKNCLAYDSTIEACYLFGDFGVYSDNGFTRGKSEKVLLGKDFYIGKKMTVINDLVKDGYPFFAGNITLEKDFVSDGKPTILVLSGEYCLSVVKINGKIVNKSYFSNRVDISDFIAEGNNHAEITLYTGNRNLLGPHHLIDDEDPAFVGPFSWELVGSWKNGVSTLERPEYSFVRFGLFK